MSKQKCLIGLTVALAVIGVGLLVSAFATECWVSSAPTLGDNSTASKDKMVIYTGESNFGIFKGEQVLNYVTGRRSGALTVVCAPADGLCAYVFMRPGVVASAKLTQLITAYKGRNRTHSSGYNQTQYGLFSFGLWLSVIVFLSLSVVMGLVTIGFSMFNVCGQPIETVTGPMGLYLWNGLALLFVAGALAVFATLYLTQLCDNFMLLDDYRIGWRSLGHTRLGFSFYLLVGAAGAFLLNLGVLGLSQHSASCSFPGSAEKEVDNGMILY